MVKIYGDDKKKSDWLLPAEEFVDTWGILLGVSLLLVLIALPAIISVFDEPRKQVDVPQIGTSSYKPDGNPDHVFDHFQKRLDRIEKKIDDLGRR